VNSAIVFSPALPTNSRHAAGAVPVLCRNDASLFDGNTASWVEMVSTNILGNAMATRMAVQDMRRRGSWGHVINMVGLSGHRIPDAAAGGTFFAATKFAVRAITEGLRQEARAAQVIQPLHWQQHRVGAKAGRHGACYQPATGSTPHSCCLWPPGSTCHVSL